MREHLVEFAFILLVPIAVVAGAVVTLFAAGALLEALDHRADLSGRVGAAFRRAPAPGHATGPRHYYQPYWKS